MLFKLFEATLDQVTSSSVSSKTQHWLDDRYQNDFTINFAQAVYNKKQDFLELIFFANSTYGGQSTISATDVPQGAKPGQYTIALRFYNVGTYLSKEKDMGYAQLESALKEVFHKCNVKFYSDDPSYFYQGVWSNNEKHDMAIYKFPGPEGDGTWDARHPTSSGSHVTKHIAQVCNEIDSYVKQVAQNLQIL